MAWYCLLAEQAPVELGVAHPEIVRGQAALRSGQGGEEQHENDLAERVDGASLDPAIGYLFYFSIQTLVSLPASSSRSSTSERCPPHSHA